MLVSVLLLLLSWLPVPGQAAPVVVNCSVQISQSGSDGYRTDIECASDNDTSGFFVVVQNATAISDMYGSDVTYTLNGVVQVLGNTTTDTYLEDGSLVFRWFDTMPALVAFGFFGEGNALNESGLPVFQQSGTTLSITANCINVSLPELNVRPYDKWRMFSLLRFSGIDTLLIHDSTFDSITGWDIGTFDSALDCAAVTYVDDNLDARVNPAISPTVSITNTTFANFLGVHSSSALNFGRLLDNSYNALSITDSHFISNRAEGNGSAIYGSLFNGQGLVPQIWIYNCSFTNNTSTSGSGGAVHLESGALEVDGCAFADNTAGSSGGALFFSGPSVGEYDSITVRATSFTNNKATTAGAVQVTTAGADISNCIFTRNTASLAGGALAFDSCAPDDSVALGLYTPAFGVDPDARWIDKAAYVSDSYFDSNSADSKGGGAIHAISSRLVLVRANFTSNNSTVNGGVLYGQASIVNDYEGVYAANRALQGGGAVYAESCNVTFNNTLLQGNNATRGGAVSVGLAGTDLQHPGSVTVELNNCTASGNTARTSIVLNSGYGGCLSAEGSNVTVRGGVWASNVAAVSGGALDARGSSTLVVQDGATMRDNLAAAGTGGAANINGMSTMLIVNASMHNNSALSEGGSLFAASTGCVIVVKSTFSASTALSGMGGCAYVSLPLEAPGCTVAAVEAHMPRLSAAGAAALPPTTLRPTSKDSARSRRLLQEASVVNRTGLDLNLLVIGTAFAGGRAVSGGGVSLRLTPGSAAVLDQVTISGCGSSPAGICSVGAGTSDVGAPTAGTSPLSSGGGLSVTVFKPIQSMQATCSADDAQMASIDITSSTFTSNVAGAGTGGAAAAISTDATLSLQVAFSNSTFTNNTAANGGALSVQGAGAFLAVLLGSRLTANTALPSPSNTALGSSGGCVYAQGCQGLLIGNATQLSRCQALPGAGGRAIGADASGRSVGGGIMVDGCRAVAVDGASVTDSAAGAGGGIAVRDTAALLLLNAPLSGNVASAVNASASPAAAASAALDALAGVGGGLWVAGKTATLIRGSTLSGNSASLLGGGAAAITQCFNNATGSAVQIPAALANYGVLTTLAVRAAASCYSMSVQSTYVSGNKASGPSPSSPGAGAGGAFFGISNSSILMSTCADIQSSPPGSLPRSADLGALRSNLTQVASCPRNGNLAGGFGDIIATTPSALSIDQKATTQQVDPSAPNATVQGVAPLVWFAADDALVAPSTAPPTPMVVALRVLDAAGQDMSDPYLSSLFSITATISAAGTNTSDILDLYGTTTATYDSVQGAYRMNGLTLRAVVGRNYTLVFALTSLLGGGGQFPPLQQAVVVPGCGNGEVYLDALQTACRRCDGSSFGFAQGSSLDMPAPACHPCPGGALCPGGAVLVPADGRWHSSPNSTQIHTCLNSAACARDDNQVFSLQACQAAWYAFKRLVQLNMTQSEVDQIAAMVLRSNNCTLYTVDTLAPLSPASYQDLLCADGYGGNLCGVCVKTSEGKQTALQSNNQCSECSPEWLVYLINAALFMINLIVIMIQVFAALGEQVLSNAVSFADIFGAIITHVQYLVVILKLQFHWPRTVTDFLKAIASTVSFAGDAFKFASITCLSDGSPEAQATYQMGSSLTLPLILVAAATLIWIVCYYWRQFVWHPRLRQADRDAAAAQAVQDDLAGARSADPDQVALDINEDECEAGGKAPDPGYQLEVPCKDTSSGSTAEIADPSHHETTPSLQPKTSAEPHNGVHPDPNSDQPMCTLGAAMPLSAGAASAEGQSGSNRLATQQSITPTPAADAWEDLSPTAMDVGDGLSPPDANQLLQSLGASLKRQQWAHGAMPSLRRNQTDLRRWQLPGTEKAPDEALWFDAAAQERERQQRREEDRRKLTLTDKFRLLDKYMPLSQQLAAVIINTCFVVYQGWASAVLSPFGCRRLDTGQLDASFDSGLAYYAGFQQATAPSGYWRLNMNQACYQGIHLTKWTPIGAIMSFVIGIGIPSLMFLPVFLNRKDLTRADVQLRWGWLYIRFYYGRLPYWMAVQALQLLLLIVVQTFAGGLSSVIEQAVLLQLTLILNMVFTTCMWPLVHPLLILTSFLSNAVLIFTLGLAIMIGDGSSWTLTVAQANAVGAFIVIINAFFVVLLLLLYYKHASDVIQERFHSTRSRASRVVGEAWQRSMRATRYLRSMTAEMGSLRMLLGQAGKTNGRQQAIQGDKGANLPAMAGPDHLVASAGEIAWQPGEVGKITPTAGEQAKATAASS